MSEEIHRVPPSDHLDLHNFKSSEAEELIDEFIWSCEQSGITRATIIHGKGSGAMRKLVESRLQKNQSVISFQAGSETKDENWRSETA